MAHGHHAGRRQEHFASAVGATTRAQHTTPAGLSVDSVTLSNSAGFVSVNLAYQRRLVVTVVHAGASKAPWWLYPYGSCRHRDVRSFKDSGAAMVAAFRFIDEANGL